MTIMSSSRGQGRARAQDPELARIQEMKDIRTTQRRSLNRVVQQKQQQLAPLARLREKIRRTQEVMDAIEEQIRVHKESLMLLSDSATAAKQHRRGPAVDRREEEARERERSRRHDHFMEEIARLRSDLAKHEFKEQKAEREANRIEREIGELENYIRVIERRIEELNAQIEELEARRASGGHDPNDPRNQGPEGPGGDGGAGAGGFDGWGYTSFYGGSGHYVSGGNHGYDDDGYPYAGGGGGGGYDYQRAGQVCATPKGKGISGTTEKQEQGKTATATASSKTAASTMSTSKMTPTKTVESKTAVSKTPTSKTPTPKTPAFKTPTSNTAPPKKTAPKLATPNTAAAKTGQQTTTGNAGSSSKPKPGATTALPTRPNKVQPVNSKPAVQATGASYRS